MSTSEPWSAEGRRSRLFQRTAFTARSSDFGTQVVRAAGGPAACLKPCCALGAGSLTPVRSHPGLDSGPCTQIERTPGPGSIRAGLWEEAELHAPKVQLNDVLVRKFILELYRKRQLACAPWLKVDELVYHH